MANSSTLEIDGRDVKVTNLGKVFYPKTGFTKGEVIDYYIKVSPVLLPHLKNRPISLKRYPDGVEGFFFYEKNCPSHHPDWMKTISVDKSDGSKIRYCAMNDLSALVWAANLADLELHTFLHKAPALLRPTAIAFDLDPGPPANIIQCCHVALQVRKIFTALGLDSYAKTSGSKGMQVYVPLNTSVTYERTKAFAHTVATALEHLFPETVISRMERQLRKGKVFVDWSQNDDKKTTVTVYSLRAKEEPTVSTPVTWGEVETALRRKKELRFTSAEVLKRVKKRGDLFAPVLEQKQKLPPIRRLEQLLAKG
jgi:bifunctional non-homologous end joining protein LigD